MNPLLRRLSKGDHGERAEKKAAKRLGGRQTPGSGSQQHSKGDVVLPTFLVENKATLHESMSVKLEWLKKISLEAIGRSREPALAIQFVDGQGKPVVDGSWVMIPERVFRELVLDEGIKRLMT